MIRFVRSAVPKLPIATSEVKTNGWDNDILIINKQQVFRFPKTDQITDQIKNECELLKQLSQKNPVLQIPRYKMIYEGEVLKAVTYPFLSGESLNEHPFDLRKNPENAQLLGDFLTKLHQMANELVKIFGPALAVFVLALLPNDLKAIGFLIDALTYIAAALILIKLVRHNQASSLR